MDSHIEKTIAEAERKLAEHLAEVSKAKHLINQLCGLAGIPPRYEEAEEEAAGVIAPNLQGDEYYGKSQHVAAREILERRRSLGLTPSTLEEIYDDLIEGGWESTAKSAAIAKRGLQQMLAKNSKVFHRLPNGKYGLADWYEGVEKPKRRRRRKAEPTEGPDAAGADDGRPALPSGEQEE